MILSAKKKFKVFFIMVDTRFLKDSITFNEALALINGKADINLLNTKVDFSVFQQALAGKASLNDLANRITNQDLANALSPVQADLSSTRSDLSDEIARARAAEGTLITTVGIIQQSVNNNTAAILTESLARSTSESALANRIDLVFAQVGTTQASVTTEATARATADSAIANQISALVSQINDNTATILTEQTTRANADSALAARTTVIESRVTNTESSITSNIARIATEEITRAAADSALATQITTLSTQTNTNINQVTALITDETTARTDAISALAGRTSAIEAAIQSVGTSSADLLAVTAQIDSEANVRASADSALSVRIDTLTSTVNTNNSTVTARIAAEETARASADSALASRTTSLESRVTTNEGGIATNTARIATEETTRANADSALSSRIDTVIATANTDRSNTNASITTEATARANADLAIANRSSIIESSYINNSLIRNSNFQYWSNLSASVPDNWQTWSAGGARYTDADGVGLLFNNTNGAFECGVQQDTRNYRGPIRVSARVKLISGTGKGAGVLIYFFDVSGAQIGADFIDFFTYPDANGTTGDLVDSRIIRQFDKLITNIPASTVVVSAYPMGQWIGFNQGSFGKQIVFYSLNVQTAGVEGSTVARIATEETTRATADSALSSRVDSLTAQVNTNLGNTNAAITTEATARANADNALASRATTLESQFSGSTGSGILNLINANKRNLVDVSWWKAGAAIPWDLNGGASNTINSFPQSDWPTVTGPDGSSADVWLAGSDATQGAAGGWNGALLNLDPDRTYRFMIPIVALGNNTTRSFYWGTANVCNLNTTTIAQDNNPYFVSTNTSNLVPNRWYLFVGYIYPRNSTNKSNDGAGIFDMVTGNMISQGTNYCFHPDGRQVYQRAYQFYASLVNLYAAFGRPIVELIDGTESALPIGLSRTALVNARIATEETTRANADSALASRTSTIESTYLTPIASGILNNNPSFVGLSNNGNNAVPPTASGWGYWYQNPSAANVSIFPGKAGGTGWAINSIANQPVGIVTTINYAAEPGWYVVRVAFELLDGVTDNAGIWISCKDSTGAEFATPSYDIQSLLQDSDQAVSGLSPFRYADRSKLVYISDVRLRSIALVAAQSWFNNTRSYVAWHHLSIRKATDSEILTQKVNTNLTSTIARIATEETTRANADSALATRASVIEAAAVGTNIVRNNNFQYWASQSQQAPDLWGVWTGSGAYYRDPLDNTITVLFDNRNGAFETGIIQDNRVSSGSVKTSVRVKSLSGTYKGSGVLIYFLDSNFNFLGQETINFFIDPDTSGRTGDIAAGDNRFVRQFDKLTIDVPLNTAFIRTYLMGQWTGFNQGSFGKQISFYSVSVEQAGVERVTTARIATEETTRANADSSLATQISTVNARYGGSRGLTPNADFSNGLDGWAPQSFTLVSYGSGATKFNAVVSPFGSATQIALTKYIKIDDWSRGFKLSVVFEVRGAPAVCYAGIACYDLNGNALGNLYISSVIGQTFNPAEGTSSYKFSQVFQNIDNSLPVPYYGGSPGFIPGTYFVQPLFIANYTSVAGAQVQVNSLSLEDAGAAQLVDAKVQTEITTRANADSALSSRIDTLTAQVNTNQTSSNAAISSEASARATADSALANRATTLESQFNLGTDSNLFARLRTEETTRANADAALAQRTTTLESSVTSTSFLRNNRFNSWTNPSDAPDLWPNWAAGSYRVQNQYGNGIVMDTLGSGREIGVYQDNYCGRGTYRLSVKAQRTANTWAGSGVLIYYFDSGNNLLAGDTIDFIGDVDIDGNVGNFAFSTDLRQFDKTISAPPLTYFIRVYLMGQWIGFNQGSFGKQIIFYSVDLNQDGIQRQTNARIATEETTRASADSALASRTTSLESRVSLVPEYISIIVAGSAAHGPVGTSSQYFNRLGQAIFNMGRSYTVLVFNPGSNDLANYATFDVYGDPTNQNPAMVNFISNQDNNATLIVVSNDEPQSNRFSYGLGDAMANIGAGERFFDTNGGFKFRSAYCLVGRKGLGKGGGQEWYAGIDDNDPLAYLDLRIPLVNGRALVGADSGATTSVARIAAEESTRATADSALGSRIDTVSASVGNLNAAVTTNTSAIADVNNRLAAANWSVSAVTGGGRAQITVRSSTNGGAGVDIVGDVNFAGSLNVGPDSGQRLKITSSLIAFYDINNISRIRLGFW